MVEGMGGAMDCSGREEGEGRHGAHNPQRKPQDPRAMHAPFTGLKVVNLIVTEQAVIEVTPEGLVLRGIAADTTVAAVTAATAAGLIVAENLGTFD